MHQVLKDGSCVLWTSRGLASSWSQ